MEVKLNILILLGKSSALALEKKKWADGIILIFFFLLPSALNNFFKGNCTFQREDTL